MILDDDFEKLGDDLSIKYSFNPQHPILSGNTLNFLYTNIRSFGLYKKKFREFESLIVNQNCLVHVIVISETWLNCSNKPFATFQITPAITQ